MTTEVKELPMLFATDMVKAILEDRKTMTRRVVKDTVSPEPARFTNWNGAMGLPRNAFVPESNSGKIGIFQPEYIKCPYGAVGDRIWVRETWSEMTWHVIYGNPKPPMKSIVYRAGPHPFGKDVPHGWRAENKWKTSIFMPRKHSRITLEITDVRVERLQDISEEDARAEGVIGGVPDYDEHNPPGTEWWRDYSCKSQPLCHPFTAIDSFRTLWDSINAKKYPWDSNPWVFAISFRRL